MIRRLVIFLIRRRLHLKKYQAFRFTNQQTDDVYCFTTYKLIKINMSQKSKIAREDKSLVSLNWLLDDNCKIEYAGWVKYYGE